MLGKGASERLPSGAGAQVLERMRTGGMRPDQYTYTILLDICSTAILYNKVPVVPAPPSPPQTRQI